MTREELHELVDIEMDARDKGIFLGIFNIVDDVNIYHIGAILDFDIWLSHYQTFSDFTQAVKDYIKSLDR